MRSVIASIVIFTTFMASHAGAASTVHPWVGAPEDQTLVDSVLEGWFSESAPAQVVYVAPPDGSTVGTGTEADPRRDLIAVVAEATAGTAIYLAPGVYPMSEIRDQFGHDGSVLRTGASGEAGNPIILSTDPARYDAAAGEVAVLDFGYDNAVEGVRTMSIDLDESFWLLERLEIRNMDGRGIWLSGHDNVIRDNYLHHVDTPGTNNDGLILISSSGRPTNNVIMGNHLSHAGVLDRTTGALIEADGVNAGCIYTETRQSYDSDLPDPSTSPTLQDYLDALLPADSHVYIYNNYAHHCVYAYGTKNQAEGPYFFLSNVAHDVRIGVRNTFSGSVIRNNIFFAGAGEVTLASGVSNGASASAFWGEIFNGHQAEISHNTIVGAGDGISLQSGWGVHSHDNLVVEAGEGLHVHRNQYDWYDGGAWPGIRGEWLLGDLDAAHPYYAIMPGYLQEMEGTFVAFRSVDNCYDAEPVIAPADFVQPENDVTGMVPDENYQLVADVDSLFVDLDSYVRDFATYENCGSRVTLDGELPDPDPEPDPDPDPDPTDPGTGGGGAVAPGEDGGCGCRLVRAPDSGAAPLLALGFAVSLLVRRRRGAS